MKKMEMPQAVRSKSNAPYGLAKKGLKPNDIVDKLPQPPEEDNEDDWEGDN